MNRVQSAEQQLVAVGLPHHLPQLLEELAEYKWQQALAPDPEVLPWERLASCL